LRFKKSIVIFESHSVGGPQVVDPFSDNLVFQLVWVFLPNLERGVRDYTMSVTLVIMTFAELRHAGSSWFITAFYLTNALNHLGVHARPD
jgi:hypothetical protein